MDDIQNLSTEQVDQIANEKTDKEKLLSLQQDWWISYCALGGLLTLDGFDFKLDGGGQKLTDYQGKVQTEVMQKVTVTEFAEQIGVTRQTLSNWRRTIPNFNARVYERRAQLFGARESQLFNRLYLIAMSGNGQPSVDAAKTLLGHFSNLQLPTQHQEVKHEGLSWGSLMEQKRNIVEAEIVDAPSNPAS